MHLCISFTNLSASLRDTISLRRVILLFFFCWLKKDRAENKRAYTYMWFFKEDKLLNRSQPRLVLGVLAKNAWSRCNCIIVQWRVHALHVVKDKGIPLVQRKTAKSKKWKKQKQWMFCREKKVKLYYYYYVRVFLKKFYLYYIFYYIFKCNILIFLIWLIF